MDVIKQQMVRFSFWVRFLFFRKSLLPEGLAREPPQIVKIPKCLDLIDGAMVLCGYGYGLHAHSTEVEREHRGHSVQRVRNTEDNNELATLFSTHTSWGAARMMPA